MVHVLWLWSETWVSTVLARTFNNLLFFAWNVTQISQRAESTKKRRDTGDTPTFTSITGVRPSIPY